MPPPASCMLQVYISACINFALCVSVVMHCNVIQCVAVCCSRELGTCKLSQTCCVAVCSRTTRCVATCCSVLRCVAVCAVRCCVLQCAAVGYNVLPCVQINKLTSTHTHINTHKHTPKFTRTMSNTHTDTHNYMHT